MPVLLYPLMSVVFLQFSLASKAAPEGAPVLHIGALTTAEALAFDRRFDVGYKALQRTRPEPAPDPKAPKKRRAYAQIIWYYADLPKPTTEEERRQHLEYLEEWLRERKVDLIVSIPDLDAHDLDVGRKGPAADRFLPCRIYVQPNNPIGVNALKTVESALAAADSEDLKQRLNVPGVSPHILMLSPRPVVLEKSGSDGLISLAALVPLILILMTITGAVYPAIDLTAGERERGTLEILVATPVPRFELLTAKYLSVLSVAILTALVNLVCMAITLSWSGMAATVFGGVGISLELLVQVLALLLLFAAFFSAVLLCLTSFGAVSRRRRRI